MVSNIQVLNILRGIAVLALCMTQQVANALPFNQDMAAGQNMVAGSVMRPKDERSVPMGSLARWVPSREVARTWTSPNPGDANSIVHGKRLFAVNCSPCHGSYAADGSFTAGAVSWALPGPDLSLEYIKAKADGHFFEYIHYGGIAIMPAYGYKLSIGEHWDVVNYLRSVQAGRGTTGAK